MVNFRNDFEHTTPGTTATQANSGGGSNNAFTSLTVGTGATNVYETMPWGGSKGMTTTNGTTANIPRWDDDTATETRRVARCTVWLDAAPSANAGVMLIYTNSGTMFGTLGITTGRQLQILNAAGSLVAGSVSTTVLQTNKLYYVEFAATSDAGANGTLEYRLYDSNGSTVLETNVRTGLTTVTTPPRRVRFGANTSTQIAKRYWDDLRWEPAAAGSWLGPLGVTPPTAVVTNDRVALVKATSSTVPSGTLSYSITQTGGTATTPEQLASGVWAITPHATETLTFNVTVTGSLGGSDVEAISVSPNSGVSTDKVERLVKVGGVFV